MEMCSYMIHSQRTFCSLVPLLYTRRTIMDQQESERKCVFCSGNHLDTECNRPIFDKLFKLSEERRCYKCFSNEHLSTECTNGNCLCCDMNHDQSICIENEFDYDEN